MTCLMVFGCIHQEPSSGTLTEEQVEAKIDSVLKQLTLEEKVMMCHANSTFSTAGVERLGIPELAMSDGPHGVREEYERHSWVYAGWKNDSSTAFPALTCLAATFNPDLSYKLGKAISEEARYRNKDILLGPGVNIYRTPLNGRNFEYMGEDPYLASAMSASYIKGVQSRGVAACLKHYVLNNQEQSRLWINVKLSERALHEIYLPAFKASVQQGGVWSIMASYNQYKGQYCAHNEILLNDILREDWGFDGVVISDWGATHDTREAAYNGLDLEMGTRFSTDFDNYYLARPYLAKLKSGEIDEQTVNDKVRRILRLIYRTSMRPNRPFGSKLSQEHFDVAREVAREGIVLLKNEDGFFPVDPNTTKSIAVIGENATRRMTVGGGSSELRKSHEISPLEGIRRRFANVKIVHSMGYSSPAAKSPSPDEVIKSPVYDQDSLKLAAIEAAAMADVVLFVGGLNKNEGQDCENLDRAGYGLPFGQDELLKEIVRINKNVGVINISGNAYAMPWLSDVKAVIQAWFLGSEAGHAIADVISGDVTPSGKLPFTFPVKLEDNGAHAFNEMSYPGDNVDVEYKEDILVGYRWHDTKNIKPLFEFGFGLSYTSFDISKATTDNDLYGINDVIKVAVEIRNTGKVQGAEVIQVYAHDVEASVLRPEKELKGFKKVMLQQGETRKVEIEIPAASLAYYDEDNHGWKLETGRYQLMVGTSSRAIKKVIEVKIIQ